MTKKELLDKIDSSTIKFNTDTAQIYNIYYPQLYNLLFCLPDKTEIKYADGTVPQSILNFPPDFDAFCRKDVTETESYLKILLSELQTWISSSSVNGKVSSIRADWYNKQKKMRKKFFIAIGLFAILVAIVASLCAILEQCGVIKSEEKIGGIIGAIGFSVDVTAFVIERILDLTSSNKMESAAAAAIDGGDNSREFKYFENVYNRNVAKWFSKVVDNSTVIISSDSKNDEGYANER